MYEAGLCIKISLATAVTVVALQFINLLCFSTIYCKEHGPVWHWIILSFKFIRTIRQVKEEENMLIPSVVPSFCLLNTICNPCLVSFHMYFVWRFRGRTNSPFYPVQFKVWLSRVPALWQCYHNWSSFVIPILWGWAHAWWQQQSRFRRIKYSSRQRFGFFPELHLLQPYVTSINIVYKSGKNWFMMFSPVLSCS